MQDFSFAQPLWFYAGIAAAVGVFLAFHFLDRKNRRDLGKFASEQFLAAVRTGISRPRRIFKRCCFIAGVLLLFATLARPQVGFEWREVKRKGIDILFAIDSSRSMLAEDMSPNRLERVKLGMIDFVEKLDGDRIGLLPFSGSSFLLCPLTLDYNTFKASLDAVDADIIPHKGTDIASAIREADAIFEEAGNNHRILVVLTDGEDLQGEAFTAAREAAENGMIIHTVGIGSAEGELIPIGGSYLRDEEGNPVKTKLDEAGLKAISEATGGTYANFGQLGEGLQTIYQQKLALVPKEELKQRMQKVPVEQFQWPLGIAILLFLLDFMISDRRRPTNPAGRPLAKAATLMAAAFLTLSVSAKAESAPETYNNGIAAFTEGKFDTAQQAFNDTLANTTDLDLQAKAYYNLGNTLFSIGAGKLKEQEKEAAIADWEKSLTSYESALKLNPDDADAEYNHDYVKKLLEELKKEDEQQENQDQQEKQDEDQEKSEDQESQDDSEKQDQENSDSREQEKENQEQSEENKENESQEEQKEESGEEQSEQNKDGKSEEEQKEGEEQQDQSSGQDEQEKESQEEQQSDSGKESEEEGEEKESQQSQEGKEGKESEQQQSKPGEEGEGQNADQVASEQTREVPGQMSQEEARELLKALQKDEKRVILIPQKAGQQRPTDNKTKGKDW